VTPRNYIPSYSAHTRLVASLIPAVEPCQNEMRVKRPIGHHNLQRSSHLNLRLPVGVDLCSVEEIYPMIPGCLHALLDYVAFLSPSISQPSPKGEDRHLQSRRPKVAEHHVFRVKLGFDGHCERCASGQVSQRGS